LQPARVKTLLQDSSPINVPASGTYAEIRMVCLTGFMGSGKSTVGRLLAAQLAWRFADLDAEIEQESGLSISQIFAQQGEAVFREIEHRCLVRILGSASARETRLVLALGGGTFAQPRNAALIRELGWAPFAPGRPAGGASGTGAVVIWLDCPMNDLLQRCVLMGDRPLFRDEASFRKLYEQRLPFYRQADYRVESGGEPMCVVEQILALGIFKPAARIQAGRPYPGAPQS
jgi:shikimate kinase